MKPTILFDLDGTLIDSTSCILQGFKYAYDKYNLPYPGDESVKKLIGYPLELIFKNLNLEKNLIDGMVKVYKEHYQEIYLDGTTLLEDAKDSVLLAYKFANLGVVTTKTSKYSQILLKHLGIKEYFKAIIGREDVTKVKPDKEPIILALNKIGSNFNNSFMIGDTKLDALAAKNADIKAIGVSCGYGDKKDLDKFCDSVLPNSLKAVEFILNNYLK